LRAQAATYEAETRLALAGDHHLSVIELPEALPSLDPIAIGRQLHARYVVATSVTKTADGARAEISLLNATDGRSIFVAPIPMIDQQAKFARELYQIVYPEIAIDEANALTALDRNSTSARLWRAAAAEARTGTTIADPPEFAMFEAVLAHDPDQRDALMGLASALILKVSRDQSKGVNRTEDLRRAASLLERAKSLSADPAEVAFQQGMLDKLQFKFSDASTQFEIVLKSDPENETAAAQAAHVEMFLGRLEEAFDRMEAISNIGIDSAFIAGETALMAGHPTEASAYFDRAVSSNPTISRNHAWRAVALWRVGRKAEAHEAALRSQTLPPPYLPSWMAQRANLADKRYRDARDACVQDFKQALAYAVAN